jgi:SAM-dependent methyltransferase
VIGIDPASAMIEVARKRPGGRKVEWLVGDAGSLGSPKVDLVVITGNVSGYFVDDRAWAQMLHHVHQALRPGGRFAFGSRNLKDRAWERWSENANIVSFRGGRVRVDWLVEFSGTGEELLVGSEYRFWTLDELVDSLEEAGFVIDQAYGNWRREPLTAASENIVLVARRPLAD